MGHANLVVTRAGPRSLHAAWRPPPGPRSFDLLVASYCEEAEHPMADGVMQTFVPGRKVEGWNVVLERCAEVVARYDRVALIDDDILAGADAIGRCFAAGAEQSLSIWQPSLSWDSYFTYAGTLHNPMFALRYVNVVEMMCPFFSAEALQRVKPLFGYGWESGIDLVWCSLLPRRPRQFAILDDVVVRHTRPVGALKQANGFVGRDYEDDIHACLRHFGMRWPSLVAEGARDARGREVGRAAVAARLVPLLWAAHASPTPGALRLVADHARHQLCREPVFAPAAVAVLAGDRAGR